MRLTENQSWVMAFGLVLVIAVFGNSRNGLVRFMAILALVVALVLFSGDKT